MNTSAQTHQELAQLRRRVQIFYTAHTVLYAAALGLLVWRPAPDGGPCAGCGQHGVLFPLAPRPR